MMVSQLTHDQMLLDSIHRYARASLFLVFAASQSDDEETPRLKALNAGLLSPEEADKLEQAIPCKAAAPLTQAATIWMWIASAIERLDRQKLTKGPPHYCALMNAVNSGSTGVSDIEAYLETPIPLGYVHLLCLMVKLHNVILTILMALTTVMLAGGAKGIQPVGMFRTA